MHTYIYVEYKIISLKTQSSDHLFFLKSSPSLSVTSLQNGETTNPHPCHQSPQVKLLKISTSISLFNLRYVHPSHLNRVLLCNLHKGRAMTPHFYSINTSVVVIYPQCPYPSPFSARQMGCQVSFRTTLYGYYLYNLLMHSKF